MALEIGKVADADLAQDDPLADRRIAPEPAGFQLRRRMDARLGILEARSSGLSMARFTPPAARPASRAYCGLPFSQTTPGRKSGTVEIDILAEPSCTWRECDR